ncbi:MAG: M23 family metallopeptidase [Verrucomicrobia bacterium]|nr:M23 family metallopeptidase [Verrucomicrobiota bacterium]
MSRPHRLLLLSFATVLSAATAGAQPFHLPTANRALFEKGGEEKYFAATPGKTWVSGTFGCVRTDGWQMHEGLDIRCLQHDKHGEPVDPVAATADGEVAYLNAKPSLSNYGNYLILRHRIEGMEIFSLYAHLSRIEPGLRPGTAVRAGQVVGTMGRTSNTGERIGKDRAHVHFELNLLVNDRFPDWFKRNAPGERNDHGVWNGQNLVGIDPRLVFLEQQRLGAKFSLVQFLRSQTELCRVFVRAPEFSWLKRYPQLIRRNPRAEKEGVAGYEIALNFNALPYELTPRAAAEIKGAAKFQLLSVNAAEQQKNPARRLVTQRGSRWELADRGLKALGLLTY